MVDAHAMADIVAMAIKAALGPVQAQIATLTERVAGFERQVSSLPSSDGAVTELRERVVAVEVKSALPAPEPPKLDLLTLMAPARAQVDILQASVDDINARLKAVESTPLPEPVSQVHHADEPDSILVDLRARVAALEVKDQSDTLPQDVAGVRERLAVLETKSDAAPVATPAEPDGLADLKSTVAGLVFDVKTNQVVASQDIGSLRERMAVLETKAPVAGPAGADGKPGRDGLDGKDGADGLGFDDLAVDFDHDRTLSLTFQRGLQKKTFPVVLPYLKHQGIYQDGRTYEFGDVVTWAGSQWHCNDTTTAKPGEGAKAWTLVVKRGRDGKDGKDAPGALPVVSVRG